MGVASAAMRFGGINLVNEIQRELQAKYDYLFRTKILDFYKGEPIE